MQIAAALRLCNAHLWACDRSEYRRMQAEAMEALVQVLDVNCRVLARLFSCRNTFRI